MQKQKQIQINGKYSLARCLRKLYDRFNLICFTFLQCLFASLGAPKAASLLMSDSLSPFSLNFRAKARRNKPNKLQAIANFRITGSTLVYLFAAGSEMHGTTKRLTNM